VALKRKLLGDDHPDVAISLGNLTTALVETEQWDEAAAVNQTAISIVEKNDAQSMNMVFILFDRAEILIHEGRLDEAAADLRRLREVEISASVGHSILHAETLIGEGELALARRAPAAAVAPLESAHEILLRNGERGWMEDAILNSLLAAALARPGGDHARAAILADRACAAFVRSGYIMRERHLLESFNVSSFDPKDAATGCANLDRKLRAIGL